MIEKKYRLLIVEDDLINQRVLACMLQDLGYAFDVASDGLMALEYIKNTTYHLILMDIRMPKLDGIETTKQIREKHGDDCLPIVALTAHVYEDEIVLFKSVGMNDVLAKPVFYEVLQALLSKWLENNTERSVDGINHAR